MIYIPSEIRIKSTLQAGSVYYFAEESFTTDEPHYFIVISSHLDSDTILLLVCSSSQIEKVKKRRRHLPPETLVEIDPGQYPGFTKMKPEMNISLVEKLRKAVIRSPMIEQRIKHIIK